MYSDGEVDAKPDILDCTKISSTNLLPKTLRKDEAVLKAFMDWQRLNNSPSFTENTLLGYFQELSENCKSASLLPHYSILRNTLNEHHNVDIETYPKLRVFLKRQSESLSTKNVKKFTPDEVNKFINQAPDNAYLAAKVALIMGIMGASASELHSMHVDDLQDLESAMLITVPNSTTKTVRKFTITGHFYNIYKKYIDLRPSNVPSTAFFLNYQDGECTADSMGISELGGMGSKIASFLNLPKRELYIEHRFRTSSDNSHEDMTTLEENHWNSTQETGNFIAIKSETVDVSATNETLNFDINSTPSVHFTNCSNITINFITNNSEALKDPLMSSEWSNS